MPKQFADIVKLVAEKTGLDLTDKSMIDLLSVNATIGDEAFSKMETSINGLMTVETAKHNPILSAHFKSQALLPADTEIQNLLETLGLEDSDKAEFLSEKSTYKKIGKLVEKARALEAKKANGKGGDTTALTAEIAKLNAEILKVKSEYEAKIAAKEAEAQSQILNYALEAQLQGKAYSEAIPEALRVTGAMSLVNKELAAKGAKVIRNADGVLKMVQLSNPELDYMENNKPVGFGEFSDRVLSTHAMLKVSDPNKKVGATHSTFIPSDPPNNEHIVKSNQDKLQSLEKSLG